MKPLSAFFAPALLAALLAACATPPASLSADAIGAVVAAPDRSAADRENDVRRKPREVLAFIGVRPGMKVLDISAARGYTSELLARAVGPSGKVYAQSPNPGAPLLQRSKAVPALVPSKQPFEDPAPAEVANGGLDLVTLMFNYHDFGHMGLDRGKINAAAFRALKPGGMYVIADHSGRPGTGISEAGTLHRIEEQFLVREVEAAGFRLAARGDFLRNPADPRDRETPVPPMPKDEFILKFVKP